MELMNEGATVEIGSDKEMVFLNNRARPSPHHSLVRVGQSRKSGHGLLIFPVPALESSAVIGFAGAGVHVSFDLSSLPII